MSSRAGTTTSTLLPATAIDVVTPPCGMSFSRMSATLRPSLVGTAGSSEEYDGRGGGTPRVETQDAGTASADVARRLRLGRGRRRRGGLGRRNAEVVDVEVVDPLRLAVDVELEVVARQPGHGGAVAHDVDRHL